MSVDQAFINWAKLQPVGEDCCCKNEHHGYQRVLWKDKGTGKEFLMNQWVRRPDSQVCPRERAWRKYISTRDRVDYSVSD